MSRATRDKQLEAISAARVRAINQHLAGMDLARRPLQLRESCCWSPTQIVVQRDRQTAIGRTLEIEVKRPTARGCAMRTTLHFRAPPEWLERRFDYIEAIALIGGGQEIASVTSAALRQLLWEDEMLVRRDFPLERDWWLELPFFARHPLFIGELDYSRVQVRISFTGEQRPLPEVWLQHRCEYLRGAERLSSAIAPELLLPDTALIGKWVPVSAVNRSIAKDCFETTVRSYYTVTLNYSKEVSVRVPDVLCPVALYVSVETANGTYISVVPRKLHLDGVEIATSFAPRLPGSMCVLPADSFVAGRLLLELNESDEAARISLTIEHDRLLLYCHRALALWPASSVAHQ